MDSSFNSFFFFLPAISLYLDDSIYKFCPNWELCRCQSKSFLRLFTRYTAHFKENPSWPNWRHIMIWGPFSSSHSSFSGFFRNWFIRENANPHLPFSAKGTADCHAASLDLLCCDPASIERLHSKVTELYKNSSFRKACHMAFLLFSVL